MIVLEMILLIGIHVFRIHKSTTDFDTADSMIVSSKNILDNTDSTGSTIIQLGVILLNRFSSKR